MYDSPIVPRVSVIEAASPGELAQVYAIRRRVFIEEQAVPAEIELDPDDADALHVLALEDSRAIGCGRMVAHGAEVKMGRMAVLPDRRRHGIGALILKFLIEAARQRGCHKAILHAQLHAEGFYLKYGFAPVGEVFEEAGIPHRRMERGL